MFNEEEINIKKNISTRKKVIVISILLLIITLATFLGALISLNIIKLNKLKGTVTCDSIPTSMQPRSEENPNGLEYGFTDINFYNAIVNSISNPTDTYCDGIGQSTLESIAYVTAQKKNINDANGIENLTNLYYLSLGQNNLESIDLTHNRDLAYLYLQANNISDINLENNTELVELNLNLNNLTDIDLTHNSLLFTLNLMENSLTKINLENNADLVNINITNNNLETIDLSHNLSLETLWLSDNNLTEINLDVNTKLMDLQLSSNQIEEIDLSHNPALITVYLDYNKLERLDLSNNSKIYYLNFIGNNLGKTYNIFSKESVESEEKIVTAYPDNTTYYIYNSKVASYNNGIITGLKPGSTNLRIAYKVGNSSSYYSYNTINVDGILSDVYTIDYENDIIDVKDDLLTNVIDNITISDGYNMELTQDNKLLIRDSNNEEVITYTLENYKLYKLTSNKEKYVIDEDAKTIDVNGAFYYWDYEIHNFNIEPSGYTIDLPTTYDEEGYILKNYVIIKNQNDQEVDRYEVINLRVPVKDAYKKVGFNDEKLYSTVACKIHNDSRCSVVAGKYHIKNYLLTTDELESVTSLSHIGKNLTDITGIEKLKNLTQLILAKNKLSNVNLSNNSSLTYLNLDENNITNINLSKNPNLSHLDLGGNELTTVNLNNNTLLETLYLYSNKLTHINLENQLLLSRLDIDSNNISDIDLSKNINLTELYLEENKLTSLNISQNNKLVTMFLGKNKLTEIDLTNNNLLENIMIDNNNLIKIKGLQNLSNLQSLYLHDNKLTELDLSANNNLIELSIDNNLFSNIYLLKGNSINYPTIKLPNNINYDIDNVSVAQYDNNNLYGRTEGVATIYATNTNIKGINSQKFNICFYEGTCSWNKLYVPYSYKQVIKVYDVTSNVYDIDKTNKIINVKNNNFDADKIELTLYGLSIEVENNKLLIKDGTRTIDTYELINVKNVVDDSSESTSSIGKSYKAKNIDSKIEMKYDIDMDMENIEVEGNKVDSDTVDKARKEHKNIVLNDGNVTFTIDYANIIKYHGEIDLSNTINDVNNKYFAKAVELSFNNKLPFNVEVSIKLDNTKNIRVYDEKLNALNSINSNNVITFITNNAKKYYLSDKINIINKVVDNKDSKHIPIILIVIGFMLMFCIGFVTYKKKKIKY